MTNYFSIRPGFRPTRSTILRFIILALALWVAVFFVEVTFPSSHWEPYAARTIFTLGLDATLLLASIRMLLTNGISPEALGLRPSARMLPNLMLGMLLAAVPLLLVEIVLYIVHPYHFQHGSMTWVGALQSSASYLFENSLEELTFRGLLLILLSQYLGWRRAILILALPFGLFHLPGTGLNIDGLKMVFSTAAYALLFSLSYLITGSMWTAISVHVTSNILLHTLLGMDGRQNAVVSPVFTSGNWTHYDIDIGFCSLLVACLTVSGLLYARVSAKPGKPISSDGGE